MKNIANKPLVVSLLIFTVLACATVKEEATTTAPQEMNAAASVENPAGPEAKEDTTANQAMEKNVASKTTLFFNVSSCSWSYIDELGKLQAVSIIDGKPQYVSSGKTHYIDPDKTNIVFK